VTAREWGNLVKEFFLALQAAQPRDPDVPGSILEGGELGYSLATAYGAAHG